MQMPFFHPTSGAKARPTARALTLGLLLLVASACNRYSAEGSFEQTIPVTGDVTLGVEASSGKIDISPSSDGQVHVSTIIRVYASSEDTAATLAEQIQAAPPVKIDGNSIQLGDLSGFQITDPTIDVALHFNIQAPPTSTLDLSTGSGDQSVSDMDGPITASVGSGDVNFSSVTQKITISGGSGDTFISQCADVEVDVGSGDVSFEQVTGTAKVSIGSGNLTVTDMSGNLTADGASGDIVATTAIGAGAIWQLSISSGNIQLNMPRAESVYVDAETSSGTIINQFPTIYSGSQNANHLTGQLNDTPDGALNLSTTSGDIMLLPQ